jgi:hypothetical protein
MFICGRTFFARVIALFLDSVILLLCNDALSAAKVTYPSVTSTFLRGMEKDFVESGVFLCKVLSQHLYGVSDESSSSSPN